MTLSQYTKACLLLSIVPALAGSCVATVSQGWNTTLADIPISRGAPLWGFSMVLSGPLSWYLPGPMHRPLLATIVAWILLVMVGAHSWIDTPSSRRFTTAGIVLWWACGFATVYAIAVGPGA